jgi:hypothetical protein
LSVVSGARTACAQAELVLLLVPQTPDPALVELFHRVEAELRLHDFRPEVLVASPGDSTESFLGAQASAQRAFAAIAIAEQTQFARLHVWIVDARTGLTRQYQVEQKGGQEPTNVVAVRAVDLLRANRAPAPGMVAAPAPPTAAGAAGATGAAGRPAGTARPTATPDAGPKRPSTAATKPDKPAQRTREREETETETETEQDPEEAPEPEVEEEPEVDAPPSPPFRYRHTLLQLTAEATSLSLSQRIGWSFGPSLGAWLTLWDRWRVGVVGVAPLFGAVFDAALGQPTIWQQLVWAELGARVLRAGRLQLSAAAGFGLHWLQAKGRAIEPYESQDASTWSWTGSLAARGDVMLTQYWSIGVTLRARIFLPPVEVAVKDESARLALPAFEGALGLSLWL